MNIKNTSEINTESILEELPYAPPFLFVDTLEDISADGVTGNYTFPEDSFFYRGHFKEMSVTPGVILTECMAQIGLVCLGIYLLKNDISEGFQVALTKTDVDFYVPVYPGEKVRVISEKIYFRFGKLKCRVRMKNMRGELVSKGEISGMMKKA